jgi:3-oxoacyl-[acyl-carrier-protein] synthase-3
MSHRIAAKITGVAGYVPPKVLSNADLEKIVETNDEWIRTRTGIRERHIVEKGTASSHLATEAAKELLAKTGTDAAEIDLIVVASVTPDMMFPAMACLIQERIGAKKAWGFDLSAACSGFAYALTVGAQFVGSGAHKKVLVIGSDAMSTILDYKDRATCVLFGDGAGAVLLEAAGDGEGILDFSHDVDGSGGQFLYMPGGGSLHPSTHETADGGRGSEFAGAEWIYGRGPGAGSAASGELADYSRNAGAAGAGGREGDGEYRSVREYHGRDNTAGAARCGGAGSLA